MDILSPTITNLIIFVLAIYVGYHVVWTVTPTMTIAEIALVTAISGVCSAGVTVHTCLLYTSPSPRD